jgi:glutamine synthetase
MVFFRMAASEIARDLGALCTFMPKPFSHRTGSGMHMHLSISDQRHPNLFLDPEDKQGLGLSSLAYHFLGGILSHARALCALVAPCVNSYKRLVVGQSLSGHTWAPAYICYGLNNRSAMVRVPFGRLELRLPDSSCNPYLAAAAVIVAGLDGIERRVDPPAPKNLNIHAMSPDEIRRQELGVLPQSLPEALDALERDTLFGDQLGKPLINELIRLKRMEWLDYHRFTRAPSARQKYLACQVYFSGHPLLSGGPRNRHVWRSGPLTQKSRMEAVARVPFAPHVRRHG